VRFGFYGDDVTGSVDALLQFRRAGVAGVLVTEVDAVLPDPLPDVVGFAGIARSLPTAELEAEVRPRLERLLALGAELVQYKACSTADSSPAIGSLGRVAEIGRAVVGEHPVLFCVAQPDFGRYTAFGHHFAREGDTIYRLDRQPTMRNHPVTPAHESDLRLHLGEQTALPIDSLPWTRLDAPEIAASLADDSDAALVVADALSDAHLDALARGLLDSAARGPRFAIGSGGLSGALGRVAEVADRLPALPMTADPASGPVLVLSGSASARTRAQVAASGWRVVDAFAADAPEQALAELEAGRSVVVSSLAGEAADRSAPSAEVEAALARAGDPALRAGLVARLVVCGGDTSGAVLRRLGVTRLAILAAPWGNAPLLEASGDAPHLARLELVLKGGQVGHASLLDDIRTGTPLAA